MLPTLRHSVITGFSAVALIATLTGPAQAVESGSNAEVPQAVVTAERDSIVSSASRAELVIETVFRDNPNLRGVAGQAALIGETAEGELSIAVDTQPEAAADRADILSSEDLESRITVVAKGVEKGAQLPSGRYESAAPGGSTTTVIESLETGFRVLTVLEDESANQQFSYKAYRGAQQLSFLTTATGEIHVGVGDSNEFSSFGVVEPPWAFDANGSAVKTTYEVSTDRLTLTQKVTPDTRAAYPIVADPAFTFWAGQIDCSWGSCTFYLERAKTYWLRDQLNSLGWTAGVAVLTRNLCVWVVAAFSLSGPGAVVAGSACVAAMAGLYWSIKNNLNGTYRCLTIKKYHWSSILIIGNVSGSNSHCFYNV